jgi:hypothetical protein
MNSTNHAFTPASVEAEIDQLISDVTIVRIITIKRNEYDEYEVPTLTSADEQDIYFTDDKQDAIGTAHLIWDKYQEEDDQYDGIEIRIRRGTYNNS